MEAVANPAASTPAKPVSVDSLNDAQRSEWLKTGELPKPTTEESAPSQDQIDKSGAESGAQPAKEAESAAASEPAKSQEPGKKPEKNAESRIQELLADRKRERERAEAAERRLQEFESGKNKKDEKADPSTAKPVAEKFDAKAWTEQYEKDHPEATYEQMMADLADARADHKLDAYKAEQKKLTQQSEAEKANREIQESFKKKVDASIKKHPDFAEKVFNNPEIDSIAKRMPAVDGYILDSDHGTELLYHLATTEGEIDRLAELSAYGQIRELVKVETSFASPEKKAAAPVRKVTAVPDPPSTVGGQNNAAGDEVEEAVKNRDVGAYMSAMNAREAKK